ncbi:MAG TPA: hypothetical protein VI542_08085 [Candidatus Tectomicrobia bacterium]
MTSGPHRATTGSPASASDGSLSSWRRWGLTLASLWFMVIVSAFVLLDMQRQLNIPTHDAQLSLRHWLRLR